MDKCLQKTHLSLKSPVMNFLLKTMMLLLKHSQSVKGRQTLSPLKINPKPWQGSPRQNLESEDVHFDYSFDQVPLYLLSVGPNRFSFSADLGEASDLPERALTGEFSGLPKTFPAKTSKNPKRPAESSKVNKKPLFIKNCNFIQNEKKLQKLFYEINPDIKLSKTTFYSLGNFKLLPKTTNDYQLINHYAFSSAIYRLTNKHITIEESANTFHNSTFCNKKVSITATLEDIEFGCPN